MLISRYEQKIESIPINNIYIGGANVRLTDREVDLEQLMDSIKKHGLLQPIIVIRKPDDMYELVVGQRRYLACKKLREKEIMARIYEAEGLDPITAKVISVTENMQRRKLNYADTANAITSLYHVYKDEKRVAVELGLTTTTVRDYIEIEELATEKAKKLLKERKIFKIDVKRVIDASSGDKNKADRILEEIRKLTNYEKRRLVEYGRANPRASAEDILKTAKIPRIEPTVILNLSPPIAKALAYAEKKIGWSKEDIATKALVSWLHEEGFIER